MIFLNKISVCKKDSKINEVNPNLQKLHKMAQSWPLCPKVDLADDVTIVKTKVKERLDESTIIDVEQDIFNRLEKNSICNPHPGQEIKISHLGEDTQAELKKIFTKYEGGHLLRHRTTVESTMASWCPWTWWRARLPTRRNE